MSPLAMSLSICEGVLPILFVGIWMIVMIRKRIFSWSAFGIGISVFIVFAEILEGSMHAFVLGSHGPDTFLLKHPVLYVAYGALAAGIFEEFGRYVAFRWILKSARSWQDALSYGLGHGGIEAFLVGTVGAVEAVVFNSILKSGKLPANLPAAALKPITTLIHQPAYVFALGTLERMDSVCIQLALSILVLYAVRKRRLVLVGLAVLLHAFVDVFAVLYQVHLASLMFAETAEFLFAVVAVVFILKSRKLSYFQP